MGFQLLGLVAFALNVWGNLLLTTASNRGHIIRLCSNAVWIVYSPLVGAWALLLNHMTFAGINVLGYRRWHRMRVEQKAKAVCGGLAGTHVTITCEHCTAVIHRCCVEGSPREFAKGKMCGTCLAQLPSCNSIEVP